MLHIVAHITPLPASPAPAYPPPAPGSGMVASLPTPMKRPLERAAAWPPRCGPLRLFTLGWGLGADREGWD